MEPLHLVLAQKVGGCPFLPVWGKILAKQAEINMPSVKTPPACRNLPWNMQKPRPMGGVFERGMGNSNYSHGRGH